MHNVRLASTYSETEMRRLVTNIEEAAGYDMYSHWLPAQDFSSIEDPAFSAGVWVNAKTNRNWPCYAMDNGKDTFLTAYLRRHREWKNGHISLKLHLGGDRTGAATVYTFLFSAVGVKDGDQFVFGAAPLEYQPVDADMTGGTLRIIAPFVFFDVTSEFDGIQIIVGRAGSDIGDTATGYLYLYGVEVMYQPANRPVSTKRAFRTTGV